MKNIIFSIAFIFALFLVNTATYAGNGPVKKYNKKTVNKQRTKCNSKAGAKKKAYYNSIQYR